MAAQVFKPAVSPTSPIIYVKDPVALTCKLVGRFRCPHPKAMRGEGRLDRDYFARTNVMLTGAPMASVCPVGVSRPVFAWMAKTTTVSEF